MFKGFLSYIDSYGRTAAGQMEGALGLWIGSSSGTLEENAHRSRLNIQQILIAGLLCSGTMLNPGNSDKLVNKAPNLTTLII